MIRKVPWPGIGKLPLCTQPWNTFASSGMLAKAFVANANIRTDATSVALTTSGARFMSRNIFSPSHTGAN
jgi:hypothetical protein